MICQYHKSCTVVSHVEIIVYTYLFPFWMNLFNVDCSRSTLPLLQSCKVPSLLSRLRSLSVEVKGRISSFVSLDLKWQMHRMATLQKRSLSNRTNPTVTVYSDGFRLYFLWRLNPNTSFHLFSFPRSVHFGILSGLLIVLRGASLCEIFPLPKTTECGKRWWWGEFAHSCLSWFPSKFAAVNVVTGRAWPVFSPTELYRTVHYFFPHFNFICHSIRGWEWMIFTGMNYIFSPWSSSVYIRIPQGLHSLKSNCFLKSFVLVLHMLTLRNLE